MLDAESLWIEFAIQNKDYIAGVVYRHPTRNISNFTEHLGEVMHYLTDKKTPFVICGDFNIDLKKHHQSSLIYHHVNTYSSFNCHQLISNPTRVTPTSATLIDHIYTNLDAEDFKSGVLVNDISDHFPIYAVFMSCQTIGNMPERPMRRNYANLNHDQFLASVDYSLQQITHQNCGPSEKLNAAITTITDHLNSQAPLRKFSRTRWRLKNKPWITPHLQKLIKAKNTLYKCLVRDGFSCAEAHSRYKKKRNEVNHLLEKSKRDYYQKQFLLCKGDSSKLWKTIRTLIDKKDNSSKCPASLLDPNSQKYTKDHQVMANVFNDYFTNIGKQLANSIPSPHTCVYPVESRRVQRSFVLYETTVDEIVAIINGLSEKKSIPSNDIPTKILKLCRTLLAPFLSQIFNECLQVGVYPHYLKCAQVIPIHKGGQADLCTNYRPISLLSPINKIFEKLLYTRLYSYLDENKLLTDYQYGFRNFGYSTALAIYKIHEALIKNLLNGLPTCGLFCDL